MKTRVASLGHIDFALNVVSFPEPDNLVQIRGEDGSNLFQRSLNFESINVNLTVNGKKVYVMGYGLNFTAGNTTEEWFGRNTIVISNMLGSHTYIFTLETTQRQTNRRTTDSFFVENVGTISSVGLLLMICILTAFGATIIRKKMKRNISLSKNKIHMEDNRDSQTRRCDAYEEPINSTEPPTRHNDYSIPETYMEIENLS
ncbi:uncharacterized protein LOC125680979 [Ostrea edulis]|uniref:uncharacterized protein LOC125680979 n=1 Tax=Ostrea edulis TaxID=37623 RepID=UPI002095D35C|nr:uncharacterized protein LOC125680979 [Ostrea edulis]